MRDEISSEELLMWKKARDLVKEVYCQALEVENYSFNEHIRRAALAVLCNIAEGYGSGSQNGFRAFLFEAKTHCSEVKNMLLLARFNDYMKDGAAEKLMRECDGMMKRLERVMGQEEKGN